MMIHFRMVRINVEQFAILADAPSAGDDLTLTTTIGYRYSTEARRVACVLDLRFEAESGPVMLLKINCEFAIRPDDWATMERNDGVEIPRQLQEFLAVHTIGTARGILHCKTEGTPFNMIILPPVNVAELLGG